MRDNWEGNTELQKFLQRVDPREATIIEALAIEAQDVIDLPGDWSSRANVISGGIRTLEDGGLKISSSRATLSTDGLANEADAVITTLGSPLSPVGAIHTVEIQWDPNLEDREIDALTVRLDPDTGGGVEVAEWRAQLFRLVSVPSRAFDPTVLAPISDRVSLKHDGGSTPFDATFEFGSADKAAPVRVGRPPRNAGKPRTYIFVWALKSDGTAASNVAWMGDAGSSGSESVVNGEARHLTLTSTNEPTGAHRGTAYAIGGVESGMPDFLLEDLTFAATVIEFTGANKLDLGASPTEDVEVVATTQTPGGSTILTELAVPGSGTWIEVADGDVIGKDNTPTGGNDLSGLSVRQDYDARVTLTPNAGTSPIIRRLGIVEREATDLRDIAALESYSQAVDPVTLKAEIPEARITITKDGIADYRDLFTELFSDNHIGQVEFRAWVGSSKLARQNWMLLDHFLVDETASERARGRVVCTTPLVALRGIIPTFSGGQRQPKEYADELLSAVHTDLLSGQLSIADRYIGPGVTDIRIDSDGDGDRDADALVSKTIEEADGKAEADAIAYLAGGALISSQGRIKFQRLHQDPVVDQADGSPKSRTSPAPIDAIPLDEGAVIEISPGYSERVMEFFAPWGWDPDANEGRGKYVGEARGFSATGLTKLGSLQIRSGEPPRLPEQIARWIPQSGTDGSGDPVGGLAVHVVDRQTRAFGTGMITFSVRSPVARPQLEPGDVIAVETDRLVARHPSDDRPLRGVAWMIGPVVAVRDPLGHELVIWVRSYEDILPSTVNITRTLYAAPRVASVDMTHNRDGSIDAEVTTAAKDTGSIRYATSTSAFPSRATTQSGTLAATDSEGHVSLSALATLNVDQTLYLSILAYENADGSGAESFQLVTDKITAEYFEPEIFGPDGREDLVINGDFEDGWKYWTETGANGTARLETGGDVLTGGTSIEIQGAAGGVIHKVEQSVGPDPDNPNGAQLKVRVRPGEFLHLIATGKVSDAGVEAGVGFRTFDADGNGLGAHVKIIDFDGETTKVTKHGNWEIGSNVHFVTLNIQVTNHTDTDFAWFDDLHMIRVKNFREILAARMANQGSIQEPRAPLSLASSSAIDIAAHDLITPFGTIGYDSGQVTTLQQSFRYHVYADDPEWRGGGVTYQAQRDDGTEDITALVSGPGLYYVGSITTTVGSEDPDSGGGGLF